MLRPIAVNENLPVIKPFKLCRKRAQTATTSATEFEHLDVLTPLEPGAPPYTSKARPHPFQPLLSDKKVKKKKNHHRRQYGYRHAVSSSTISL